MEKKIVESGRHITSATLEEMDKYWNEAKKVVG
jgi:uncharacterized protein YabN with tetrapyrrole methylase and pyrophosphatase domain